MKNKNEIHPCLDANYFKGMSNQRKLLLVQSDGGGQNSLDDKHNWDSYLVNGRIRRLTPKECERLQGFPDGWTEGISDSQRYKCLGNAVTVNVIEAIAGRILAHTQSYEKERK